MISMWEIASFFTFKTHCLHKTLALLAVLCVTFICVYQEIIFPYDSILDCILHPTEKCHSSVGNAKGNNYKLCIEKVTSLIPRRFKTNENLTSLLCENGYDEVDNTTKSDCVSCFDGDGTVGSLLTLFSTWPDDNKITSVINITCYNWSSLMPLVQPVVFTNNSRAAGECSKRGWKILPVGRTAAGGAPVLKDMFLDIRKKVKSVFYGFANGDILFDESLLRTLMAVILSSLSADSKSVLIVGLRTNVNNVTFAEAKTFKSLGEVAKRRGKLFIPMSADYFITDASYPWPHIPEVVIGRRGYDNWLVLNALRHNRSALDVTKTVLAVHQTTGSGNREGFSRENPFYNIDLLAKLYKDVQYLRGATSCTKLITVSLDDGVFIRKRTAFPKYC